MSNTAFQFKKFKVDQEQCTMKIGTDGVLLGAWANCDNVQSIIDIGTGTGVIALMLAQRNMQAQIQAIEIEESSYLQAKSNFENSDWKERLSIKLQSIQDFSYETSEKYDLIISNPPFFSGGTFSYNENRNQVRHTVKLPTGDLLTAARRLMNKDAKFCVILPYIEGLRFIEQATFGSFYCTKLTEVHSVEHKPIERLLIQFELEPKPCVKDTLVIQKSSTRNDYTDEYIALTKDFYLFM